MENEEKNIENLESKEENVDYTNNYIEAINEMKKNSVDKKKYDELYKAHEELTKAYINGERKEEEVKEEPIDIQRLREDLFNKDSSNLEYISNALKLRQALIDNGEMDPFLPYGKNIVPTEEDIACANRVAQKLQDCVDYAKGDSDIFTSELQRIMVDTQPVQNKRR